MVESSHKQPVKATTDTEQTKYVERANRILDAASELLQRWGYKKTTIDDIARQAGVAKGTIYLHWQAKQDLFMALIVREKLATGRKVQQGIEQEPDGLTLHTMIKYGVLATLRNPLIKAIVVRDIDMLGDLLREETELVSLRPQLDAFNDYMSYQRAQGIIRTDVSLQAQVHTIEAITMGFLVTDPLLPAEYQLGDEERANLAADTIKRAFEIRPPTQSERQVSSNQMQHIVELAQDFLQQKAKDI